MSKKCTPLWREAHFQVKMYKTHQVRTTFGSWDVEKVHAVVARSTFPSQNVQNTPALDHFLKLRCRKSARRCGAKQISKSKCTKHTSSGPLFEVAMSKKCTPLWREADFQVKMYKTHHVRTTFGGSDVDFRKSARRCGAKHISKSKCRKHTMFGPLLEAQMSTFEKVHAVVARSRFPSQNVQNTPALDHFLKLRCRKSARRCGAKQISKSKCTKHTMFGPLLEAQMSTFEKVHAVVARSTFPSQNVQSTPCSDHFWRLRCRLSKKCTPLWREAHFQVKMYKTHHVRTTFGGSDVDFRKSARRCGAKHISKSKCTKHTMFGPLLAVQMLLRLTRLHYITLHFAALHYITLYTLHYYTSQHYRLQLQLRNYSPLHSTTLHYTKLHCTTLSTLHFATLHDTTLHYTTNTTTPTQLHSTTLHYTTLHYTTLPYTTLHSTTLQLKLHNYTPLHYTTLHYTTLHYTRPHYTTLHYATLHYLPLHFTTLLYTTFHYTTPTTTTALHYTPLHYTTLHYITLNDTAPKIDR